MSGELDLRLWLEFCLEFCDSFATLLVSFAELTVFFNLFLNFSFLQVRACDLRLCKLGMSIFNYKLKTHTWKT